MHGFSRKKFRCSVIEESEKYYPVIIVVCPGINNKKAKRCCRYIDLEHINNDGSTGLLFDSSNLVKIPFSNDRLADLLDIVGYVSAAEIKFMQAGNNDFQSCNMNRAFHFHIKVRDYKFWDQSDVQDSLAQALFFISAADNYKFKFYKAGPGFTPGTIDGNGFKQSLPCNLKITLFSGGLDSLTGAVDLLETTRDNVFLISYQPGQPGISGAQTNLYNELEKAYPGRCTHIKFHRGFAYGLPAGSAGRTVSFLYNTVAFACAEACKQHDFYMYANGIHSMNFGISRDLMNAGVSGAAHPGTLSAFEKLFTLIAGDEFKIHNPFLFKTKAGVIEVLKKYGRLNLMPGSVSCSGAVRKLPGYTHCGVCTECIIRIFAAYAAGSERFDKGIYSTVFLRDDITDPELIKKLVSIIKQAQNFSDMHFDDFYNEWGESLTLNEKPDDGKTIEQGLKKFYDLCRNHANDIEAAVKRMGDIHNHLFAKYNPRSFFSLIVAPKLYQREEENCGYAGQENLKEVPVKGLKKLAGETCESLIKKNRIVEVMEETRKNRKISSLIVQELKEQRYSITKRNEDTISDYFRKLDLQIKKARTGRLYVLYN